MNFKWAVIIGLGIAIAISIISPFIASPNPDGLESAAMKIAPEDLLEEKPGFSSPMPDYIIPSLGDSRGSEALAIIFGTLLVFALGLVSVKFLRTNKN